MSPGRFARPKRSDARWSQRGGHTAMKHDPLALAGRTILCQFAQAMMALLRLRYGADEVEATLNPSLTIRGFEIFESSFW